MLSAVPMPMPVPKPVPVMWRVLDLAPTMGPGPQAGPGPQRKVVPGAALAGGTAAVYLLAPQANGCLVQNVKDRIEQRALHREQTVSHQGIVTSGYQPPTGYFPRHDDAIEDILHHCEHDQGKKVDMADPANREYLAAQLDKCKRVDCHEKLPDWETKAKCERGCEKLYTTNQMRELAKLQKAIAKVRRHRQGGSHAFILPARREVKALKGMANRFAASLANGHEVGGTASRVETMEEFVIPKLLAE
ncbi:MAG: hypothetical protein M1826_000865 [Phylliscum demangeonii]|nr:MAG: hypothetical protein M1826_000865 [Phylliscum demangeonii]